MVYYDGRQTDIADEILMLIVSKRIGIHIWLWVAESAAGLKGPSFQQVQIFPLSNDCPTFPSHKT